MFPGPEHGEVLATPDGPSRGPAPVPPRPPMTQRVLVLLRSLSWKAWGALAVVLIGLGFLVSYTGKSGKLHLVCQHNVRNGELRVWAGDQLVYVGKLTTSTKKRFGFLPPKGTSGFSQTVRAPDGHYDLRVQVVGDNFDQSRSIPVDLAGDTEATVSISAYSRNLQVSWKDTHFSPISADSPWHVKYAKALFITALGSILSAMMGIVVREILEKLRHPKQESVVRSQ